MKTDLLGVVLLIFMGVYILPTITEESAAAGGAAEFAPLGFVVALIAYGALKLLAAVKGMQAGDRKKERRECE